MNFPSSITTASIVILTPLSRSKVVRTQVSGYFASIRIPSVAVSVDLPETAHIRGVVALIISFLLNMIFRFSPFLYLPCEANKINNNIIIFIVVIVLDTVEAVEKSFFSLISKAYTTFSVV